jgi:hypothetical protein
MSWSGKVMRYTQWSGAATLLLMMAGGLAAPPTSAQASAIQSAAPVVSADADAHGRQILAQMVDALGGPAWRERRNWKSTGNFGNFYKGQPNDVALKFEEFHQTAPFATRFVVITHMGSNVGALLGLPVGKDHSDVVELLTPDDAYEVTYRGKKELPKDIVTEQLRQRAHSLDSVMGWLKQPGTGVFYEGMVSVARRPAERVSISNATNDTVTFEIDASTHLPVSREFRYRDAMFKDIDVDREEYDNYQLRDGVMTPFTVTRYKNGDMIGQRFIADIHYNLAIEPALFNPDVPLSGKPPKR